MKTRNAKKIAITVAIIVAICAVFALLFFGLSQLLNINNRGAIIAEYDGIPVYDKEVQDIINYHLSTQYSGSDEDVAAIVESAIRTYVRYKALELDLEERGYKIDETVLKNDVKATIEDIETTMKYSEWCEQYHVSKDFLKEDLRRYAVAVLYNQVTKQEVTVTDQEAREYYSVHALSDYAKPAGYYWTSILRPIRDLQNAAEVAEAKAEMNAYLEKIKNGTMTFEDVEKELNEKYNATTGYPNSIYAGEDTTAVDGMLTFQDEDSFKDFLRALDEAFETKNLNAEKDSDEYNEYLTYYGKFFQANVYYALQNMKVGDVWESTLDSYVGTYIIRLDRVETENAFVPYEEVSEEIMEILKTEKLENNFVDYLDSLETKYQIRYYLNTEA